MTTKPQDDEGSKPGRGPLERPVRRRGDSRVSRRMLPHSPRYCSIGDGCVYRDALGICDEPAINKGNGDSKCHRMNNRDVLAALNLTPNVGIERHARTEER